MSGILGWAIGPLIRALTYRQWVHLLLGGVLLLLGSLPEGYDTPVAERGHRLSTVLAADLIVELDRLRHGERRPRRERG